MYSGIILTFCWNLVLVKSFPALVYDYYSYNPNIGNLEELRFRDDDYVSNDYSRKETEKSSPCLQDHNGDVKCLFNHGAKGKLFDKLEFATLPGEPTETVEFLRQIGQDRNSAYDQNLRNLENAEVMEVVPSTNPNYNVYQFDSSPKHYNTYIHGLIPSQEQPIFVSNVYPSENHQPFNRPPRHTHSYEEFLAQLSHDAMMNNILPTMSYLRTPEAQIPYASGPAPVRAAYPHAPGGCAQPVHVSCSPVVSRGYIAHQGYQYVKTPQIQIFTPYVLPNRKVIRDKVKVVKPAVVSKQDFQNELTDSVPINNS